MHRVLVIALAAIAAVAWSVMVLRGPTPGEAAPVLAPAPVPAPAPQTVPIADGSFHAARSTFQPPTRIRIPSIGVDASVVAAGLTASGAEMDVPAIDTVGWYSYSSKPGEVGSTLLAGHVDGEGRPGVFWSLRKLQTGATVEVGDGAAMSQYRVASVTRVPKTGIPAEAFRRDGEPVLTLITCGGDFDSRSGHYRDNVVVTAVAA